MSQDMMQALSGSSLLSLSVGTLPAVKSGMMLDANPFASQLALMTGPETATSGAAAVGAPVAGAGELSFAMALAQTVAPVAKAVADAAPLGADAVTFTDIPALPEDASPSQIIEAVLGGAMTPAPVAVQAPAAAADPLAKVLPAVSAPETAMPVAVSPEALPAEAFVEDAAAAPHTARPRRAVKLDDPVATAAEAAPVAAPVIDAAAPAPMRPQAYAPETGSVRVAISATAAPIGQTEAVPASDTAATVPAPVAPLAEQPATVDARPIQTSPAPVAAPRAPSVTADSPARTVAQPTPLPADAQRAAEPFAQGEAGQGVGALGIPSVQAVQTTQAVPASSVTQPGQVAPAPVTMPASPEMTQAPAPAPELAQASDMAATAQIVPQVQVPVQPQRTTTAPPRATVSTSGQRAIQAAAQSARPAQALSALFDLADPAAPLPAATLADVTGLEAFAAAPAEAVPPSWAAALNAVVTPVTTGAAFGLTAPVATGNAQAAPLETLAFDAGFVGGVEAQIARVVGGDQMVRMQIMPEHMGRIDIEMLAGPDRDQVRITTEHDAVRDTLVQSQMRLEQDLRNSGNRATDVTVELRQQSAGTQGGSAQQQRGQSGQDAGSAREAMSRQAAADTTTDSKTAQRRPRDNVRYA